MQIRQQIKLVLQQSKRQPLQRKYCECQNEQFCSFVYLMVELCYRYLKVRSKRKLNRTHFYRAKYSTVKGERNDKCMRKVIVKHTLTCFCKIHMIAILTCKEAIKMQNRVYDSKIEYLSGSFSRIALYVQSVDTSLNVYA